MKILLFLALVLSISGCAGAKIISANHCQFDAWINYSQHNQELRRHSQENAYFVASTFVSINADGAPNAYHPKDVNKHCTRETHLGLDCLANAHYPKGKWQQIIVPDPKAKTGFVQSSGKFKGYFVSQTALVNPKIANVQDTRRYVNANQVPYAVFPRTLYKTKGTGYLGDLGMAINVNTGQAHAFVLADIGGNQPMGEISLALNRKLSGHQANARTGAGQVKDPLVFVIFPESSKQHPWPLTNKQIHQHATKLFRSAGGKASVMNCLGDQQV